MSLYRERRDGFTGQHYVDELQRRLGADSEVPALSVEDVVEVVSTMYRELRDEVRGRALVGELIRRAEEPALTALLLDLLGHMWHDAADDAEVAVNALRWTTDSDAVRDVLARWATRDDAAGDAAREILGGLTSPPRDFESIEDLVQDAENAIASGSTGAASLLALHRVLTAAVNDAPGTRREARRLMTLLRHAYGPTTASFRLEAADVVEILTRIEAATPHTRPAAFALATVVTGIGTPLAVPALLRTLDRLAATCTSPRDRFAALPVITDLLLFREREDVEAALSQWNDVVRAVERDGAPTLRIGLPDDPEGE